MDRYINSEYIPLASAETIVSEWDYLSGVTLQFFTEIKDLIRTCQELLGSAKMTSHSQVKMTLNHLQ